MTLATIPSKRKLDVTNARIAAKSECGLPMSKNQRNIWIVKSTPRSGIKKLRRKNKMVTRDDLEQLVKNRGQEALAQLSSKSLTRMCVRL